MDNKILEERRKRTQQMINSINDAWYTSIGYTEEQIEFIFKFYNARKQKNRYEYDVRKWFTYIPLNKYLPRFIEILDGKKVLNFSGMYFESELDVVAIINDYLKEHSEDAELFENIDVVDLTESVIGNSINTVGDLIVLRGARLICDKPFDIKVNDESTRVFLNRTEVDSQALNFNGREENISLTDCDGLQVSYNDQKRKQL